MRTKEVRQPRWTVAGVRGRESGDLGSDVTIGLKGANHGRDSFGGWCSLSHGHVV